MLQSLIKKESKRLLNPLIQEQDKTSPEEFYWIDNIGSQMITNNNDELIFTCK